MSDDRQNGVEEAGKTRRRDDALRRSLRAVTVAWLFGAVWMYITTGAALSRYGILLGLPRFGFGLLGALPFIGALSQLPTSVFIERYGHHRRVFITAGLLHRSVWLLTALVPWVLPRAWSWMALLGCVFLSAALGHVASVVWYAWMGDLVPKRIRGRYFSRRSQLGQLVGLFVTLGVGLVLDRAGALGDNAMRITISAAFAVAGIFGMIDFTCFLRVRPPSRHTPNPAASLRQMLRPPLADRNFLRFMGFTATLTFATGYVSQFIWLYLFDVVGATNTQANAMLVLFPIVTMMATCPFWGRIIDRFGRKPVLVIGGIMIVNGATAWIFVTPDTWLLGYLAVFVATAAWPGVELANFNILLGMSESRGGRRYGTAYIAIVSLVTAAAGALSGVFGGAVAHWLGDWQGSLFGRPLTYHGVLFLISGGLRLAALGWLIGLEDTKAYSTRTALRYMGATFYSNAQHAMAMPLRLFFHFLRSTYKLNPRPRGRPDPS